MNKVYFTLDFGRGKAAPGRAAARHHSAGYTQCDRHKASPRQVPTAATRALRQQRHLCQCPQTIQ